MSLPEKSAEYFLELQTQTGWGKTLHGFAEWCAPKPGWQVLDVGCGPGLLPAIFSKFGCKAVGVDLDADMFQPQSLHPIIAIADARVLPFCAHAFDMITASNVLFLFREPLAALVEMRRLLREGGKIAMLNPSENLSVEAAAAFAKQRGLKGLAHDTLLNWAERAERNHRWTESQTADLFHQAGLKYVTGIIKVGPGFARFSWGTI